MSSQPEESARALDQTITEREPEAITALSTTSGRAQCTASADRRNNAAKRILFLPSGNASQSARGMESDHTNPRASNRQRRAITRPRFSVKEVS
jgi:hypothetical protein